MSVTKDEVKSFVRAVRIKQDAIIAATYTIALFSLLQKDIGDLRSAALFSTPLSRSIAELRLFSSAEFDGNIIYDE